MANRTPGGRFRGFVSSKGKRYSCTFVTKRAAEVWEHENRRRLRQGLPVQMHEVRRVGEFFRESFEELYVNQSKAWQQREYYLNALIELLGEHKNLSHVTNTDAKIVRETLLHQGMSASSVSNYSHIFNRIMSRALDFDLVSAPVAIKVTAKRSKKKDRVLSADEEHRINQWLVQNASDEIVALTRFLIWSGARVGEAMKLEARDFSGDFVLFRDTKNGTDRKIPLPDIAKEALKEIIERHNLDGDDKVFDVSYHQYYGIMKRCYKALDIEGATIHTFRHTTASRLAQQDTTLQKIGVFLGHKHISMTERYTHLKAHDSTEIADALNAMA